LSFEQFAVRFADEIEPASTALEICTYTECDAYYFLDFENGKALNFEYMR
jgi:hypothetical protein